MTTLILIFLGGAFWDALVTIDFLATMKGRIPIVVLTSTALTVLSCTVYSEVFVVEGWQATRVAALSLGSGVGAGMILWLNKKREEWFK